MPWQIQENQRVKNASGSAADGFAAGGSRQPCNGVIAGPGEFNSQTAATLEGAPKVSGDGAPERSSPSLFCLSTLRGAEQGMMSMSSSSTALSRGRPAAAREGGQGPPAAHPRPPRPVEAPFMASRPPLAT